MGRIPDHQVLIFLVPINHQTAVLHRPGGSPIEMKFPFNDQVCTFFGSFIIPFGLDEVSSQIGFQVVMHQGMSRLKALFQIGYCRERFIFHINLFHRIFCDIAAFSYHYSDDLPGMFYLIFNQRDLPLGMEFHIFQGWRRNDQGWTRLPVIPHIFCCINTHHTGDLFGGACVDALDPGMGIITAHKCRMQHVRQIHIIHK